MKKKKTNDLGKDPVLSLVLRLTLPAMLAQFVSVLYGIIDRMFIGHIAEIGGLALAGVGVCAPIVTLISSFGTLVGIGGSIMMATAMGREDQKGAKKILSNSFLLLLIFSGALTAIFLLTKKYMIYWFGGSDLTFPYANTYLTIYTLGTFFALLAMGLNFFITAQGFAKNGMFTVFIGAICNIILDAIFVPILHFDVAGAAWATVISQFLSCLYAVLFLFSKKVHIQISFGNYDKKLMWRIIKLGISPFIILATDSVLVIVLNTVLQKFGGDQGDLLVSSMTIIQSYFLMITGPLIGISGGVQPLVSYNFGAKQPERVKKSILFAQIEGVIFTGIMFLISRLFAGEFVQFFVDNDAVQAMSVWGIKTFTLAIVPLSFQYVLVDALTALGKIKVSLYLSAARKSLFLALTILLPFFFEAKTAFYAQPIADIIGSIQSTIIFFIVFKPHLDQYMRDGISTI